MSVRRSHPRLLILPHVAIMGGAGLYNRAIIRTLADQTCVTLIGAAAHAYACPNSPVADVPVPPRPIMPAYSGASLRAFLLHVALAPFRAVAALRWIRQCADLLDDHDVIIATSSIDLAWLSIVSVVRPELKRVCIVQENAFLTGIRGALNRMMLHRVDTVVSISRSWSEKAAAHGIASIIALNPFDMPLLKPVINDQNADIDVLFLGGGERIKGAALFLDLVERLASTGPVRAALLGNMSSTYADRVNTLRAQLAERGSSIEVPGFVDDTAPFLRRARLLVIPITDPHFCRPAVEAGLCGRTFVVSQLPDLNDFAVPSVNCVTAPSGDVTAWNEECRQLLDDCDERYRLAAGNLASSQSRFSPQVSAGGCRRIVDACR